MVRSAPFILLAPLLLVPQSAAGQAVGETLVNGSTWITDFSRSTVPLEEFVAGGPTKDGIPSIDRPRFESVPEAREWLTDGDPVAVVRLGGEVKVYPLQILMWHEIVNDEVGGTPVAVTFCPLCNTTVGFRRTFDDRVLSFGVSGLLRHSDMVMYDRETETWWQQATGEGVVGMYAGERLSFVPAQVMSWKEVRKDLPEARVLSRDTGFSRPYGRNPYVGYDRRDGPIRGLFRKETDDRLPPMERVVALEGRGRPLAIPFSFLREERVTHLEGEAESLVVFWVPGTASALDTEEIAQGRDVGSTGVFNRRVNGRVLTFEGAGENRFRDEETGSLWTLSGKAVEGPLIGGQLQPVAHGNHFWFAWVAFRPETELWRGG